MRVRKKITTKPRLVASATRRCDDTRSGRVSECCIRDLTARAPSLGKAAGE